MKFTYLLLVLILTSCINFFDKTQAEKDIAQFFIENNSNSGAGKTDITSIEIISIEDGVVKAFVTGYYSNSSLPTPESRELRDTLYFAYYDENQPRKLKISTKYY